MTGDGEKDSHIKGTGVFVKPLSVLSLKRPKVGTFAVPFRVFSIMFCSRTSPLGGEKNKPRPQNGILIHLSTPILLIWESPQGVDPQKVLSVTTNLFSFFGSKDDWES